jgi:hypothetical protein
MYGKVESFTDMMLYVSIILRGHWCDFSILNVHDSVEYESADVKKSNYEKLLQWDSLEILLRPTIDFQCLRSGHDLQVLVISVEGCKKNYEVFSIKKTEC